MLCLANFCDTYSLALSPKLLNAAGHRENFPSCLNYEFAPTSLYFPYLGERVGDAIDLGLDTAQLVVGDGAGFEDLLHFGHHCLELVEFVGVGAGHSRHLHLVGLHDLSQEYEM